MLSASEANNGRLSYAISGYPYFADHFRAIANLAPIPEDATASDTTHTPQRVFGWARSTLRSCLDGCVGRGLGEDDGTALVDSALYFSDPSAFLSQTYVVPASFIAIVRTTLTETVAQHL